MPIKIENLSFTYDPKAKFSKTALKDVSLSVEDGDFLAIVGHTGSGKSTLVTHLNGLTKVQSGKITVDEVDLTGKYDAKKLRAKVGMVFQYPEYQLFADTVELDVAFGPKNLGLDEDEIKVRVKDAIEAVGLDFDEIREKSPFELSGGQMRRVAIAGVIAMRPEILVLDEPTAGLDPKGKRDIMELVLSLKKTTKTVIMISHNMDEVAKYCNKIALLKDGELVGVYTPSELFADDTIEEYGLKLPSTVVLARRLKSCGLIQNDCVFTEEELVAEIVKGGERHA
ncbi:MAG: energy-coupling factor transporter ATPase [Clostridiales bacterium]|nr:energy-coupling factor transporter ATPase [Clostridiales bacterium]